MKITTIEHLVERINHANKVHGLFASKQHAIDAARTELMEAEIAAKYHTIRDFRAELLDTAVVCIRAAEQMGVE
jgi:predicted transcriptional regulator